MRFTVASQHLAEALTWVSRAVPSRPAIPVLSGIKLDLTGDVLRLSAFDYEQSAVDHLDVSTASEDGTVIVPGRLFFDIVKGLPRRDVQVFTEGSRLRLVAGPSKFAVALMPARDYPALPQIPAATVGLDAAALASAVGQVTGAASKDNTLPVLTGVRLSIDPEADAVTLAATDRYRLALKTVPADLHPATSAQTLLVPARALSGYVKALASGERIDLGVSTGDGVSRILAISAGSRTATTLLLDGDYPRVEALVPTAFAANAVVETAALVEAVKRAAVVAERSTPCRLVFDETGLSVEAGQDEEHSAAESLAATYDGEPLTIAFNIGYLTDGLAAMSAEYTHLRMVSATKPAVLHPRGDDALPSEGADGEDQPGYTYLLMPVRHAG